MTVRIRSGSDSRSFHGAWSDMYLFASATVRIASVIAALKRERPSSAPDHAERLAGALEYVAVGVGERRRAPGISPMFFAANATDRFTRLPQVATSSSLLRRTNSLQVKSVSWFSGPATAT